MTERVRARQHFRTLPLLFLAADGMAYLARYCKVPR